MLELGTITQTKKGVKIKISEELKDNSLISNFLKNLENGINSNKKDLKLVDIMFQSLFEESLNNWE